MVVRFVIDRRILRSVPDVLERVYFALMDKGIFETPQGILINLDHSNEFERAIVVGNFESDEITFLLEEIRSNEYQWFVDIGGYVGLYSLLFARETDGKVDTFEPVPWHAGRIKKNVVSNELTNVCVHEVAVDDADGQKEMILSADRSIEASLRGTTYSNNVDRTITVPTAPLDSLFDGETVPDFVKIDAEGNELNILRSGKRLLQSNPTLFIEIHPTLMDDERDELSTISGLLRTAGYDEYYHVEHDTVRPVETISDLRRWSDERIHIYLEEPSNESDH